MTGYHPATGLWLSAISLGFLALSATAASNTLHLTALRIEKSGIWRADPNGQETQAQCAHFQPTQAAALRWFRHASEVSRHVWLEELDSTQCSASGTLSTDAGRDYHWQLDQSGRGTVKISVSESLYLAGPELPFSSH